MNHKGTEKLFSAGSPLRGSSGFSYRILETKEGSRGMAYICAIEGNPSEEALVVLKECDRTSGTDDQRVFRDKIKMWMRLQHLPFVVPAIRAEEIEGWPYLVMPAIRPGPKGVTSVADLLRLCETVLPARELFRYFFQIVLAIRQAQKVVPGLVHGDIKPSNLLLTKEAALISDFGLGETYRGTSAYRSPELWERDGHPSVKTDLYSAGITLYEMLTGQLPFQASSGEGWKRVHESGERKTPAGFPRKGIENELMTLALACMSPEPAHRPRDFEDLSLRVATIGGRYERQVVADILSFSASWSLSRVTVFDVKRIYSGVFN